MQDNTQVAPIETPKKNSSFKGIAAILAVVVAVLVGVVIALVMFMNSSENTADTRTEPGYTVDSSINALAAPLSTQQLSGNEPRVLSINDLSDSFTDTHFTISEWNLKIKTKYAELLEYTYEERNPNWGDGSTPYATCNDEYVYCNSIVQIKIKAEYLEATQDSSGTEQAVSDRTIAYIFQDNRSLSQLGQTKARYWTDGAFITEFGNQATLIFEQVSPAGVDELGKAQCPADLKLFFNSKAPCEDIFMSIYSFDASKAES